MRLTVSLKKAGIVYQLYDKYTFETMVSSENYSDIVSLWEVIIDEEFLSKKEFRRIYMK